MEENDSDPPYLVFDNLGRQQPLERADARQIVRAILERKYASVCPPEYIDKIVKSIRDNPVHLREPRYVKESEAVDRTVRPNSAELR